MAFSSSRAAGELLHVLGEGLGASVEVQYGEVLKRRLRELADAPAGGFTSG
jgi:hypothetical protein